MKHTETVWIVVKYGDQYPATHKFSLGDSSHTSHSGSNVGLSPYYAFRDDAIAACRRVQEYNPGVNYTVCPVDIGD